MYTKSNRKNIVRQWFKYAIWSNRLKKLQDKHETIELFDLEVLARNDYYTSIVKQKRNRRQFFKLNPYPMLEDRHDTQKNMRVIQSVMDELEESRRRHTFSHLKKYYQEFLQRIFINFRFQEVFFGKKLIFTFL
jgi:replicative DNA helicase